MSHDNDVSESIIHGCLGEEEKLHNFVDMVDFTDGLQRTKVRTVPKLTT